MAPTTKGKAQADKPAKKKTSGGGGGKKKLTAFNLFMKTEMARLKEEEPDLSHKDRCVATRALPAPSFYICARPDCSVIVARFKLATSNWKDSDKNPKKAS
ncbi:hypothetical protein NMY22_g6332 [Coprinellus aureogranulatus]|nr:hypothetical protein NMY22_g6332 [Coprinellus aureogranulatus]